MSKQRICPVEGCRHVFKGNGWDGIDAHWRANHEDFKPYKQAVEEYGFNAAARRQLKGVAK